MQPVRRGPQCVRVVRFARRRARRRRTHAGGVRRRRRRQPGLGFADRRTGRRARLNPGGVDVHVYDLRENVMVSLGESSDGLVAFPLGRGSGSLTAFSQADGFFAIDALSDAADAGSAGSCSPSRRAR